MEEFKKGDLVEPNGKWHWSDFGQWPKRITGIYRDGVLEPEYVQLENLDGSWFPHELFTSGLKLNKEAKVLEILKNYVAFKKKASDNKGRNQGKKATGKPKVSKSAKTA